MRRYVLICAAAVAVIGLAIYLAGPGSRGRPYTFVCSTYNAGPYGCKAFYLLLDRLGYEPKRVYSTGPPSRGRGALLFLLAPSPLPVSPKAAEAVLKWVERGNTLVFVSGMAQSAFLGQATEWALLKALELGVVDRGRLRPGDLLRHRGVSPGRGIHLSPKKATAYADPKATLFLDELEFADVKGENWTELFGSRHHSYVLHSERGSGNVFFVSSTSLIRNGNILEADNVRFLLDLVSAHARAGRVYFDEYHHGYRSSPSSRALLTTKTASLLLAQLALVGVVYLYSQSRRFGRPIPLVRDARRSQLEYIESAGAIYERAKARPYALEVLYRDFRQRVCPRLGLPSTASADLIATRAELSSTADSRETRRALTDLERLLSTGSIDSHALLREARQLDKLADGLLRE